MIQAGVRLLFVSILGVFFWRISLAQEDLEKSVDTAVTSAQRQWDSKERKELWGQAQQELRGLKEVVETLKHLKGEAEDLWNQARPEKIEHRNTLAQVAHSLEAIREDVELQLRAEQADLQLSKQAKNLEKLQGDLSRLRRTRIRYLGWVESFRHLLSLGEHRLNDLEWQRMLWVQSLPFFLEDEPEVVKLIGDGIIQGLNVRYSPTRSQWAIQVYVHWIFLERPDKLKGIPSEYKDGVPVEIRSLALVLPLVRSASQTNPHGCTKENSVPVNAVPNGGSNPAHSGHSLIYRCLDFSW